VSRSVRTGRLLVVAGALAIAAAASADRYDALVPEKPARYVTDRAGVLGGRADALNSKLEQFERDTSNQILVWIDRKIPEGFTLEDFTVRAAQKWGPGQKKIDNGAILFVFVDDRRVRIEVGYGLEGNLTDALSNRIIQEEIVPRFRENDYAGGVEAGVDSMIAAAKGEYKGSGRTNAERQRRSSGGTSASSSTCVTMALIFGIFFVLPMLLRAGRRHRTFGGGGWWGGWGGFGGGGFGGFGGGGGGGFSGGGFSGGGGSFGGGGASGSW
jgi:uncharacterized protein